MHWKYPVHKRLTGYGETDMKKKVVYWLQIKVFIGLGTLLLGCALIIFYLELIARENHANQQLLSYVRQLETQGQAIQRRGITYARHAPRDYGPYERDVIIFYPDFMRDLDAFDKKIKQVATTANNLPETVISRSNGEIVSSISVLQQQWEQFRKGFQEKLGTKSKEPRLEWGAEYVQENQALINSITGNLLTTIDAAIQNQVMENTRLTRFAITGAGILLLIGVTWFYISVIRRIAITVKGCQRVAQGDFGYQLPAKRKDELGLLAVAFNTLSARTRLVVSMLSKMHQKGSVESKLDSLWNEARGYLPMQWLGLFELDDSESTLRLVVMRTERKLSSSIKKSLIKAASEDMHLVAASKTQAPLKYDELGTVATGIPGARFSREILKLGLINSAMVVPLVADNGWKGLIVMVAKDKAAYTDEQVELMSNLSGFMANGFAGENSEAAETDYREMAV